MLVIIEIYKIVLVFSCIQRFVIINPKIDDIDCGKNAKNH